MSHEEELRESEVFGQTLSLDDLEAISGGGGGCREAYKKCILATENSEDLDANYYCVQKHYRRIYEGGFPNCAATVESGSFCNDNDAC